MYFRLHVFANFSFPISTLLPIFLICKLWKAERRLPYVVSFAVGLAVPDETSAGLVQVLTALCTLQTRRVPLQVRGDPQDILVMDLTSAAHTHGDPGLLCVQTHELKPYPAPNSSVTYPLILNAQFTCLPSCTLHLKAFSFTSPCMPPDQDIFPHLFVESWLPFHYTSRR